MIIIRIFCIWNKETVDFFIKFNELDKDPDYNIKYKLTDTNNYTHAIVLNNYTINTNSFDMKNIIQDDLIRCNKNNIIGLSHEPPEIERIVISKFKNIKKYIISYEMRDKPSNFITNYSYINASVLRCTNIKKNKIMSIIISWKKMTKNHSYRRELAKEILKTDLPIDIYGDYRSTFHDTNDNRLKGQFPPNGDEPYKDYKFSICLENTNHSHYFTEKIINPMLLECTPIYYGCVNIDDYFPDIPIKLKGILEDDVKLLREICNNEDKYLRNINTQEIMDKVSIKNLIKEEFL
jgi:hypothetical protein